MAKTRSKHLADKAASEEPSDHDGRQSYGEEDRQDEEQEDLQDEEQFNPSRTKLFYCNRLAEEKEDPNSTHRSHAVHVKKPVDPRSCKLSPTPTPQPTQEGQSKDILFCRFASSLL